MSGLAVDFDQYMAAIDRGIDDRDFVVDKDQVIHEVSTASFRNESDFSRTRHINKRGKSAKTRREFALPINYSRSRRITDQPFSDNTKRLLTTEVQEMSVVKLDDLNVNVVPDVDAVNAVDSVNIVDPPTHSTLLSSSLTASSLPSASESSTTSATKSTLEHIAFLSIIDQYIVANSRIDLINLYEAAIIAPLLKTVGKSLYIPFALELCEISDIKSGTCIDSETWGEMCPVEIKGISGLKHTVNLPSSSGVYVAPSYLGRQLGSIFILRNSSFTMDLMMRRDSGQIEIGHRLQSPSGSIYGTVIHYGTIASHKDPVGEVWMLVQRITDGWHVPMKIKPLKTVLSGSTQIQQQATPVFDARVSTSEVKSIETKASSIVNSCYPLDHVGRKGFDPYPISI